MVQGCASFSKCILILLNFAFLVTGLVVVGLGAWNLHDKRFLGTLVGSEVFRSSTVLLVIAAAVIGVISFCGCCGAIRENYCLLMLYLIVLFVVLIFFIVGGSLAYAYKDKVIDHASKTMMKSVKEYQKDAAITRAWDGIQEMLKCCGLAGNDTKGYEVWQMNDAFRGKTEKVPESCCEKRDAESLKKCQQDPASGGAFQTGCYEKVIQLVMKNAMFVGGVGIGLACVLILGVVLGCILIRAI